MPWGVWEESTWESCTWNGNVQKIGRDQIRANSITPRRIDKDATRPYIQQQLDMFNANVTLGKDALAANNSGVSNVAIGGGALETAANPSGIVAIGALSLSAATSGERLTAVGYSAGGALSTATDGTFVGASAGAGMTGASNTVVGSRAGDFSGSNGSNNTIVGASAAGDAALTGSDNIVIGAGVQPQNSASSYQINIGNAIQRDASGNLKLRRGTTSFSDALVLEDDAVITADTLKIDGGIRKKFTVQTGTYTIPDTVAVVVCDSASDFTVTLPAATGSGQEITIKNRNTNTVTVEGDGSDSIDGAANTTLTSNQRVTVLDYAAGQWAIIG